MDVLRCASIDGIKVTGPSGTVSVPTNPSSGIAQVMQRGDCVADASTIVPADFGQKNGTPIANKTTILNELWHKLGHDTPPNLVYVYVKPASIWKFSEDSGSGTNPFGHAAQAFPMPAINVDGRLMLMNIANGKSKDMVNFIPLEDYLYGVNWTPGNEQGGIYNRGMCMLASWDFGSQELDGLRQAYKALRQQEEAGLVHFDLGFGRLRNWLAGKTSYGNCAYWASTGLVHAGILDKPTIFPKLLLARLVKRHRQRGTLDKLRIIDFPPIPHAKQSKGEKVARNGYASIYPHEIIEYRRDMGVGWFKSLFVGANLHDIAHAVVETPPGSIRAQVTLKKSYLEQK